MNKKAGCWKRIAISIGGVLLFLIVLGAIFGDEDSDAGGGGGEWKYTGEYFSSVFNGFPKDEGVVYQHYPQPIFFVGEVLAPIKVMQAMKKGNLLEIEGSDRVVWVETKRRYEDDEKLDQGYYIRRGSFEYETAFGAEKMVARYIQVTDPKMLLEIEKAKQELEAKEKAEKEAREAKEKAEEEAREAKRKAEEEAWKAKRKAEEAKRKAEEAARKKAAEEAAEQGTYELDIPLKSLCGFKLGAPPSQVRDLLQNDDGTPVLDLVGDLYRDMVTGSYNRTRTYRLAKPFRLFTKAEVVFADRGFGMHLACVELQGKIDREKTTEESMAAEIKATAELIEKKFGIQCAKDYSWSDENGKESIHIGRFSDGTLFLRFMAYDEIERFDKRAKEAQKTSIQLDANAGADDL